MPSPPRPYALAHLSIARHRHARPYATLVLSGGYEEAGEAGRYRVRPGDVLVHGRFSAHCDRIDSARTTVLDLALPRDCAVESGHGKVDDPDLIVRLAETDSAAAARLLLQQYQPGASAAPEPADALAAYLTGEHEESIGVWAERNELVRETLSRQFTRVYGVSAARYRAEARARSAWRRIVTGGGSLAEVAAGSGFADQAHMTRAVRELTGRTPGAWRALASQRFKT
jgi:AraC-like DNA-binding protein